MERSDCGRYYPQMILNDISKVQIKEVSGRFPSWRQKVGWSKIGYFVPYFIFDTIFGVSYHLWYWVVISRVLYLSLEYILHNLDTCFNRATDLNSTPSAQDTRPPSPSKISLASRRLKSHVSQGTEDRSWIIWPRSRRPIPDRSSSQDKTTAIGSSKRRKDWVTKIGWAIWYTPIWHTPIWQHRRNL